jgi:predicted transcriptional regulator
MGKVDMSEELPASHRDPADWLDGVELTGVIRNGQAPERQPGRPDSRLPMQMLNVRVPMALVDALDAVAGEEGHSRSELVRQAVEEYVARRNAEAASPGAAAVADNALHTARHALDVLARVLHRKPAA